jgi:hypothetical protein
LRIDNEQRNGVYVYPNPVSNQLRIVAENMAQGKVLQASLYDAVGKTILEVQGNLADIEAKLNNALPSLRKGLYVLQTNFDNQVWTTRLIKE